MGGFAVFAMEAAIAVADLGHECTIFTTDQNEPPTARGRRTRLAGTELAISGLAECVHIFPSRPPHRLTHSPELAQALRREVTGYDVVHIHSLFLHPQFVAQHHARRNRIPYVVSPHGALDPYLRRRGRVRKAVVDRLWQRAMLEHAQALHLTTPDEQRLVADIAPATPREVVPCGVRVEAMRRELPPPHVFRDRWLGGARGPVILNVGRLSHKKGLDVLVDAFVRLLPSHPDSRLVLAGPDDEGLGREFASRAAANGASHALILTGMLSRMEVFAALASADVWALPSRTENFGLAVLEAAVASLPIIVTPEVNLAPQLIASDAALVRPGTASAFAVALDELLMDAQRRRALGARAYAFARRYDWGRVAPQLAAMYERVAALR